MKSRAWILASCLVLASCSGGGGGTSSVEFEVEELATGLGVVWDIEPLGDGRYLIADRDGTIRLMQAGVVSGTPFATFPDVALGGEMGLFDLQPHPQFATNKFLYVSYTKDDPAGAYLNVVRYTVTTTGLTSPTQIIRLNSAGADTAHFGGRMAFAPDGKLYLTTGDRHSLSSPQNDASLFGKILRINPDGTVPADNPTPGSFVFSKGHRNPQGLTWHAGIGAFVEVEHGPSGGFEIVTGRDELNIIRRSGNFGWPTISGDETQVGLITPIRQWTPSIAPGSAHYYAGSAFPAWTGSVFVGGMVAERLVRLEVSSTALVKEEQLNLGAFGRIRSVATAPDGTLYVGTGNFGTNNRILRVKPKP